MARSILKPHATLFSSIMRASDPLLAIVVGLVAYRVYLGNVLPPEHYLLFLFGAVLLIAVVFPLARLYEPQRGISLIEEMRRLLAAWLIIAAAVVGILFATKSGEAYSRVWVTAWLVGGLALSMITRVLSRLMLRRLRRSGRNLRHIAIVGAGALGETVASRLRVAQWTGFNVIGFYDDNVTKHGKVVAGLPVLGGADGIAADVESKGIDQVWIALPLRAEERVRDILNQLNEHSVEIRFVPDIYGFHLLNHSLTEVAGLPVISLTETPMSGVNRVVKLIEDYVLATAAVIVTSPLLLLIAIGVKLSSPGPVLYRQERITWNGDRFAMLKFRTMPVDAEAASGPVFARHGERRATPFGAFLRRFSLDELPQFFNVLMGEMSLVGPRPERPNFVEQFRREVPGYMQKHLVKAGITGWAQVNDLRGDSDIPLRIKYDLYYIDNWSVWFDLRILGLTIWHVLKSRNAS